MHIRGLAGLILAPALAFGQLGSGTVTVTASSNSNAQPDQAVFGISVNSGIGQSLDGVVTALAGVGVSAGNLSSLNFESSTGPRTAAQLDWTFQLTVPLSQVKNTTSSLLALEKSIAQNNSGLSLSFYLESTQVSEQLMQNCDFGSLMNSARGEAQNIAGAAGFTAGAVVGIAQSLPGCSLTVTFGLPVSRSGPNTIMITASRTTTPLPDQALIGLRVNATSTLGLDDINAALAGAGIAGATFAGVNQSVNTVFDPLSPPSQLVEWTFTLTAPLAKVPSTLAQLVAAQQTITKQNSTLTFSFSIQGLQTSPQAQPACQQASLVSDARAQAQTVAAAAGVGVGAILNMSDQSAASYPNYDFTLIGSYASFLLGLTPPIQTQSCSMSVQFQLI